MENFILNALPSINERISVQNMGPPRNQIVDGSDSEDDGIHYDSADEAFSFGTLTVDSHRSTPDVTADEIFHHGHMLPLYSVSNRKSLSMDDTDTDTDATPIQRMPTGETLDVPKAAPGSPIKSWSTGSTRRRNPIHEFLFGRRSSSEGKEKLGFFDKGSLSTKGKKRKKKDNKGKSKHNESKDHSNKPDYAKINSEKGILVKERRRSFLPYFRFFSGGSMHGFAKKFFF